MKVSYKGATPSSFIDCLPPEQDWISQSSLISNYVYRQTLPRHIVPCGKFHRIGGAPPETFPSEKYDATEEVGGNRKSVDSPIRK